MLAATTPRLPWVFGHGEVVAVVVVWLGGDEYAPGGCAEGFGPPAADGARDERVEGGGHRSRCSCMAGWLMSKNIRTYLARSWASHMSWQPGPPCSGLEVATQESFSPR